MPEYREDGCDGVDEVDSGEGACFVGFRDETEEGAADDAGLGYHGVRNESMRQVGWGAV